MLNKKKLIPVSLLTGYLGSGKTTLLNQVLSNQKGYKVAVIVNDIGEVNIDASLIQKGGNVTQKDENLVPLSNGCICCTLKVDLMKQIISLAQSKKFDYILIEASGICEPGPIAGSICMLDGTD
ncbi:MAG: CobW family GTP-binding protein, partial [Eubacterium sp.]